MQAQLWTGPQKQYQRLSKIGEGAYGAVYKARDMQTNKLVALKVTKYDDNDEGVPSTTLREISILKSIEHQNVIKLIDLLHSWERDKFVIQLVFEFMDEDLAKFIKRRAQQPITPEQCRDIFRQIVQGVSYLHSRNIYHRDLKPQNILINSNYEVKIADFGLSRVIVNADRTYSKQIETLWYRSPQLLMGIKHYGAGVDIWSLGCILYELAQGKVLFKGDSEISFGHAQGQLLASSWQPPSLQKNIPKNVRQIAFTKAAGVIGRRPTNAANGDEPIETNNNTTNHVAPIHKQHVINSIDKFPICQQESS